jgi:histidine triad (HIT) family protein
VTIFSKIVSGEIPAYKLAENDRFFAFLDIFPLREGHTLVIPKVEIDRLFDLPDEYLAGMLLFAKPIALAIERAFDCNRCGLSVVGLEVPHAHLHLVPVDEADDLNFTRPKLTLSPEQLRSSQERILRHLHP